MRTPFSSLLLASSIGLAMAAPASAVDRDHEKSVEARGFCAAQGRDGDAETLRKCCKNMVPTQARQADWDRYTEVCMKARPPRSERGDDASAASADTD